MTREGASEAVTARGVTRLRFFEGASTDRVVVLV